MNIIQHIQARIAELEKELEASKRKQDGNPKAEWLLKENKDLLKHLEQQEQILDAEEAANNYMETLSDSDGSANIGHDGFLNGWKAHALQGIKIFSEEEISQIVEDKLKQESSLATVDYKWGLIDMQNKQLCK